jgi:hypothetical protein
MRTKLVRVVSHETARSCGRVEKVDRAISLVLEAGVSDGTNQDEASRRADQPAPVSEQLLLIDVIDVQHEIAERDPHGGLHGASCPLAIPREGSGDWTRPTSFGSDGAPARLPLLPGSAREPRDRRYLSVAMMLPTRWRSIHRPGGRLPT